MTEKQQKPEWELRGSIIPFATPWLQLRQDTLCLPGKGETTYAYLVNQGSACIVPVSKTGLIYLISQYRYPVDSWCLELPAGGFAGKDATKVSLLDLAREELREEIGGECTSMEAIGSFFPANSYSQEVCHVFLALGTTLAHP